MPETDEVRFQDLVRGEVAFSTDVIGDFVIVRSDGRPQYNFAVVVDDALMEMTHVIRGEDHISNTPRQVLLYQALGFTPPEFAHLSLVLGPGPHAAVEAARRDVGRRVPRARLPARGAGELPRAHRLVAAHDGGSGENDAELLPIDELARRFAIEDVGHSAGVFDPEKLAWMNRHYMKAAAPARLAAESLRYFTARGFVTRRSDEAMEFVSLDPADGGRVGRSARGDSGSAQVPLRLRCRRPRSRRAEVAEVMDEPGAREVIVGAGRRAARRRAGSIATRSAPRPARVKQRTGQKGRALFHPIRVALTGEAGGPELDLAVPAIDRGAELPPSAGVAPIARLPRARGDVRAHGALIVAAR